MMPKNVFSSWTILFDLDGTIAHTAPDLIETLNVIMEYKNLPQIKYEDARHIIGQGAKAMLTLAHNMAGANLSEAQLDLDFHKFIEIYTANICIHSKVYDHLLGELQKLKQNGASCAVCTNKTGFLARKLVKELSLEDYFETVIGADEVTLRKPAADHILETIVAAGGHQDRAMMIGDSQTDYDAARAANIPAILFKGGYHDSDFLKLEPELWLDNYSGLTEKLAALIS